MKTKFLLVLVFLLSGVCAKSAEEEEDYDAIVSRLSAKSEVRKVKMDSLDMVMFHAGVGYSNMLMAVNGPSGSHSIGTGGFDLIFGVDLLSPKWIAEGSFVSYSQGKDGTYSADLKEFDLRVLYKDSLTSFWGFRTGIGLAGRYLTWEDRGFTGENTTPSALFAGAIEARITSAVSIVSEIAYKRPMISESPEDHSYEFTIRLDGQL